MGKGFRISKLNKYAAVLPPGAWLGMGVFFLLFLLSLAWNSGFSVMGVSNGEAAKLVFSSFWPWMLLAQAKILAVYLAAGILLGMTAEIVAVSLFPKMPGARLAWILSANACLFALNVRKYPQLYAESLYDKGGLLKFLQLALTDHIPEFIIKSAGVILLSFFLFALGIYLARKLNERIYLAALAALVLISGGSYYYLPRFLPPKNTGPNILVIAADSLRADRLGTSGYGRNLTPNIDEAAKQAAVFDKAYTSFPRTFPAAISLLTGRLPVTHGVRHMFPGKYDRDHRGASVAEALRKNGYATSVVADFAGDVFSRMEIGFEKVRAPYFNFITLIDQRSLEIHFLLMPYVSNPLGRIIFPELWEFANNADPFLLADQAIGELARLTRKDRFFCFVFFSNVHFPYASPYPYYKKYADPSYSGRFKYHKPPTLYAQENLSPADIEQARALYDGSVEAFDAAAGRILDYLKKRGCYDNTLVIFTADHGENLYENGWYIGHGEHLRGENVLNVPLIMKFPEGRYPGRVECLTRDIDVAPTIVEYLGFKLPPGADGISLMPVIRGEVKDPGLPAFAETGIWFSDVSSGFFQDQRIMYPDVTGLSEIDFTCNLEVVLKKQYEGLVNTAKHRMLDDGRYRLIYVPESAGIRYEFYDKQADPAFTADISGKEPQKLRVMKDRLMEFMSKDRNIVFKNGFAVQER